eukprot:591606_1
MVKDFFTRMEIDQENMETSSTQIKEGIKFEERQSLCWEQMNNIKSQQMCVAKELRFKPELNAKSVLMVENKRVPRNGAGLSRKKYYYYLNKKQQISKQKYQNKKILNNPKLKEYLSMHVVERLLHQTSKEKKPATMQTEHVDQTEQRKLSDIELEEFIQRQKK